MTSTKKSSDNSCCRKIDPVQLALIGAFITVIGDFISFISALITVQEQCDKSNKVNNNKIQAKNRIKELEEEIRKIKSELDS